MRTICLLLCAALGAFAGQASASETRARQILDRFEHANQWRDHVMVAAHRAGSMQAGKTLYAENSLAAVEGAIAIGAEIVEVDIRRSKDGEFVVMHDSWLDRTTNCKGEVVNYTLAELKHCRLVVEGTGAVTNEAVSTLREMLLATRDRILINLDNKLDVQALPGMIAVARDLGMAEQVIVKENLWNQQRIDTVKATLDAAGGGFQFMPIIADDAVHDAAFAEKVGKAFAPGAIELINWRAGAADADADWRPAVQHAHAGGVGARRLAHLGRHLRHRQQTGRLPLRRPRRRTGGCGQPAGRDLRLLGRPRRHHHPDRRAEGCD